MFGRFVHVEPWMRKANYELIRIVSTLRPDLMLVIATHGVRGGTLAQIKAYMPELLAYCVYPDTPHNLDCERIHCLPFFDRVTAGTPPWAKALERLGARQVYYLPFAADPELHKPWPDDGVGKSAWSSDIAFVGVWRLGREELLEQLADFDLRVWGSHYWKSRTRPGSPLHVRWSGRGVTGDEFSAVCSQSKVSLNLIDDVGWPGPNMRSFELPACRAFSLTTRTPAILEHFREGETIECFETPQEAREKVLYYLKHDDQRRRIAAAAYEYVVNNGHTYVDRARRLISWAKEDGLR